RGPTGRGRPGTSQSGHATTFDYTADGSRAGVMNATTRQWKYFYDDAQRLYEARDPLGHSAFYEYNDLGMLAKRTDRTGAATAYTYDVDGLLTRVVRPGSDALNFRFDPLGRLIAADTTSSHVDRS